MRRVCRCGARGGQDGNRSDCGTIETASEYALLLGGHEAFERLADELDAFGLELHDAAEAVPNGRGDVVAALVVAPGARPPEPSAARPPETVVIGPADDELAAAALAAGADAFLSDSLDPEQLARAIFLLFAESA